MSAFSRRLFLHASGLAFLGVAARRLAALDRPVADDCFEDAASSSSCRRAVAVEHGQAAGGDAEERETGRVEEQATRESRHTVRRIGSPNPAASLLLRPGLTFCGARTSQGLHATAFHGSS